MAGAALAAATPTWAALPPTADAHILPGTSLVTQSQAYTYTVSCTSNVNITSVYVTIPAGWMVDVTPSSSWGGAVSFAAGQIMVDYSLATPLGAPGDTDNLTFTATAAASAGLYAWPSFLNGPSSNQTSVTAGQSQDVLVTEPTPTPTPSHTPTPTPSATSSDTPTPDYSATLTPTDSMTFTPTDTPTPTESPTATASATATETPTPSPTATPSPPVSATPTPTESPTATASATATETPTPSPTATPSPPVSATPTPTESPTATVSATATETPTLSPTATSTEIQSATPTPTQTPTVTATPIWSATATPTISATSTVSATPTPQVSPTVTGTAGPPHTPTATATGAGQAVREDLRGVHAVHKTFSPDSSTNNRLEISFQSRFSAGEIQARIFDLYGRQLAALEVTGSGPDYRVFWDGRASDGRSAPAGIYVYEIKTPGAAFRGAAVLAR